MENTLDEHSEDNQMQILKFMEVTECQSYEQAKFYVAMNNYRLKEAIAAYVSRKDKNGVTNRSTRNNVESNSRLRPSPNQQQNIQFQFTPEQALILEQRLRTSSSSVSHINNNLQSNDQLSFCSKIAKSCRNSLKCFEKLQKGLKKKINSMKKDDEKIFYFAQLYHLELHEAGFQIENELIESFQLSNVEQNQKMKTLKNQPIKPIFALVVPNRKSSLVENFLKKRSMMHFMRQNFEIIFLTLSQLKEINLPQNHSLRNIRKCPTAMVYLKNFYDLEDVLVRFEGEQIKQASQEKLKESLEQVQSLTKKWNYLFQLQKQLKQNSITSLNQVGHFDEDSDQDHIDSHHESQSGHHQEHYDIQKSLIQEQTKIYEEMVVEQNQRKKSIQIEKQRLEEIKQLREVRKMSIPEQPTFQQIDSSIQFRFRCPLNGEYITRRFLKNQKVDILYQFVDTNDSIQFQTDPERSFDLFTSFPPTSLTEKKDQLLSDVFDQEKENILIREV